MKPKIFVTRKIPENGIQILENAGFQLEVSPHKTTTPTKNEIIKGVKECHGLLSLLTDNIDRDVLTASENLQVVSQYAVGYNNIDIDSAKELGITVTNTPGVLTNATADLAFGLILATSRRIVESDRYTRAGKFKSWSPLLHAGKQVHGKTLGIVGAGRIGSAVARRGKGFDMKIIYHNRNRNQMLEDETNAKYVSFEKLLEDSDIISIHTPLTDKTKYLFGAKEFQKMKKSAVLVNTARGKCVDEKALLNALRNNEIYAVGLDVFEKEPKITQGLEKLENIVMTAHIGSGSMETRKKMAEIAAENLVDFFNEKEPGFKVC